MNGSLQPHWDWIYVCVWGDTLLVLVSDLNLSRAPFWVIFHAHPSNNYSHNDLLFFCELAALPVI